ncbi:shikimate kinase [Aquibacillus saliphilus]|uniref:shikimate kinase n=1 Tax=Aquibacillus saliphilus TaxID=1909422 RepID=UPI001CF04723|nr:shikimate kinase [Aquibacillus saliphilus]
MNGSFRERSIVFVGFMGVGKTTVGKLVANKLYRSFVDIDREIEKEYELPTTEIFKQIGEKAFREKEKNIINNYVNQKLKVISVGGGAFLQEEVRDACINNCIVFHLDISWDSWKERLSILVDSRPVLQGKTIQEIESLFESRKATYSKHNSKLMTDNQSEEEIADSIINSLKLAWELYD